MGSPLHTFKFVRLLFSLRAADCLNLPEYKEHYELDFAQTIFQQQEKYPLA